MELLNPSLLHNALSYVGHAEKKGSASNSIILDAVRVLFPKWKDDSTIPWCSCWTHLIAMNICAENPAELGHKTPGMARSWLTVGEPVDDPQPGDVAIFWRGSPTAGTGHVAFFCNRIGSIIYVLGCNQANAVTVSGYAAHRLLGYRRLRPLEEVLPHE